MNLKDKYILFKQGNDKEKRLFSGLKFSSTEGSSYVRTIKNGKIQGLVRGKSKTQKQIYACSKDKMNGYGITLTSNILSFSVYDMNELIESVVCSKTGQSLPQSETLGINITNFDVNEILSDNGDIKSILLEIEKGRFDLDLIDHVPLRFDSFAEKQRARLVVWAYERKKRMEEGVYQEDNDFLPYYIQQQELSKKVIEKNVFRDIKYIAGVDVAYNELEQRMVGAIVVLNAKTLEVVEKAHHEMEITFPYIPGLFSFREIPPILEAYKKLTIKPDLIVCDGHGIAHPKGVGMATHLGIELDIPTIGCAKKRLVGYYDKENLKEERGDTQSLIWDSKEVGVALRTQTDIKPMFVSVGHKINLQTAIDWVLKLCPKYRLPETTRQADQLVNKLMKERTEVDLFGDDNDKNELV